MKKPTYEELKKRVKELEEKLSEVRTTDETRVKLDHEFAIRAALSELYEPLITPASTIEDISKIIQENALALTGSKYGYVSSVDPETGDMIAHTLSEMQEDQCSIQDKEKRIIFNINEKGTYNALWGCGLSAGIPFFTNSPSQHPSSSGVPAGHIPLSRFLSVPVMVGEELVGQIALANKEENYGALDLETVGRLARYYALAIQRVRTEKALQESERRFRSTFEQAAVGISNVTPEGKYIRVNQRFCDIAGYTREEMLTLSFQDITHPDDLEMDTNYGQQVLNGQISNYSMEKRYLRKDGSIVWVYLTVSLLRDQAGNPQYFISVVEDITQRKQMEEEIHRTHDELEIRVRERTSELVEANRQLSLEINERKQAETELKASEAQYKRLLEGIPGILYLYSNRRGGIFYSPRVESILGYPLAHLNQNPELWKHSIHPDDREKVDEAIKNFSEGKDFELEYRIRDALEQWHWFSDRSIGRRNEGDEIIIEGVAIDITEQKKARQEQEQLVNQLREAQKMEAIGTLAGGIAHDFNNILAAIIGYSELALDILPPEDMAHSNVKEVLKAGNRAKELVKQILAFSRQGSQERKPVHLQFIIKETLKLLQATLPKTIQIRQDIDPRCGPVLADPTQVHQVIMNLCTNSYHAMRTTGGILAISLKPLEIGSGELVQGLEMEPGFYLKLEVSDTGHGMNRTTLDRIFDPYFTTKPKGEGTGLGLAVVLGIVKAHNGQVTVYSELGEGTTFCVYLPCIDAAAQEDETVIPAPLPKGQEHILFVDDEEPLVIAAREILKRLGYTITATTDSIEALKIFESQPDGIDLVVTDMTMPHMTGIQLARKIMKIKPGIPMILCTGFSEIITEKKAEELGFRQYIMKPILMSELAKALRKALDKNGP